MSDAHNKVNEALPSEVKDLILTWLFEFGRDVTPQSIVWGFLDNAYLNYDIEAAMDYCVTRGYIDSLQDPFTRQYNHRLTEEGINFINKGGNNE